MSQSLANAMLLSFKRFSCKGIHENGRACLPAFALVKAGLVLRLKEIIYDVLSDNE